MGTADRGVMNAEGLADHTRYDRLWREFAPRVQAYALRHCGATAADDVVAETFLVAWRRLDAVPEPALPWLLVVARNTIRNQRRAVARMRLDESGEDRLAAVADSGPGPEVTAADREAALAALGAIDRETLLLVAWDGLSAAAAAEVSGCTPATFRVRLHRARANFSALFDGGDET